MYLVRLSQLFRTGDISMLNRIEYLCNMYGNLTYLKRKSRSNFFTSLISIAFVLFFLGVFAVLILFGRSFTRYAKESILLKVFLIEQADPFEQEIFIDSLARKRYVLRTKFVSKEEAGEQLLQKTGEDVLELLGGVNPLMPSINVQIENAYLNPDSLEMIKDDLSRSSVVSDVVYPLEMINTASRNIDILTIMFSVLGVILLIIAFYLIIGTIRLSIYAQRMTIRTMQLIGATNQFIRRPFIINGLVHGLSASILAGLLLFGTLRAFNRWMEDLGLLNNISIQKEFIGLLIGIVLFGSALGIIGSYWAVNRYLDRNTDELV